MNDWPERVLGGSSPVHAIFRHSITVWMGGGGGRRHHAMGSQRKAQPQACNSPKPATAPSLNLPGGQMRNANATGGCTPMPHRLPGAVVPHNERERLVKLDHILIVRAEGSNACKEGANNGGSSTQRHSQAGSSDTAFATFTAAAPCRRRQLCGPNHASPSPLMSICRGRTAL